MADDAHTLTPNQRSQLRCLFEYGATSHERARDGRMLPICNLSLLGVLIRFELVQVRVSNGRTRYYLTAAGVGEARKPTDAAGAR